jgi:hypothetical protein
MDEAPLNLEAHPWTDKYVVRRAMWDWHGPGTIDTLDQDARIVATLDERQTLIFYYAEGDRTVARLISLVAGLFQGKDAISPEIGMQILRDLVERLKVVELCDFPKAVAYVYNLPRQEQDPAEALQSIMDEGGAK